MEYKSDSIPTSIRLHFGTTLINLLFTLPTIILDYYAAQSLGNPLLITLTRYLLVYFPIVLVVPSALLSLTSIRKSVQAVQTVIATIHICNIGGCLVRHGLVLVSGESGLTLFATSLSQLIFSTFVASTSGISVQTLVPIVWLCVCAHAGLVLGLPNGFGDIRYSILMVAVVGIVVSVSASINEHEHRKLFFLEKWSKSYQPKSREAIQFPPEFSDFTESQYYSTVSSENSTGSKSRRESTFSDMDVWGSRSLAASRNQSVRRPMPFPALYVVNASSISSGLGSTSNDIVYMERHDGVLRAVPRGNSQHRSEEAQPKSQMGPSPIGSECCSVVEEHIHPE
ncbi:uncharacterized protein BJ171DRAFT_301044 [Polychytrium aggregatum]|uniref:uncharacterized protein n=1 Tax=Polychytrium aggregatum TaxID=110093 RepID=UPI0022FDE9DA|nr:uncharacterized protein BJ171DRAFT_301044 [Polychytrium aggregatum]KAI9193186.1 hypothetical protein BJ171DRAFT_301044 [Polychytrium aggregatum]